MRACGGISKARSSSRPSRPVAVSGAVELVDAELGAVGVAGDVDEQVAQQAVDQPRRHLGALPSGICWKATRSRSTESLRASSTRGAWLVGPMNRPENR
jgi:hypothetical protein